MTRIRMLGLGIAAAVMTAGPVTARAQRGGQQQQMQQRMQEQQMQEMQNMVQRMAQLQERAHTMAMNMQQQMQQQRVQQTEQQRLMLQTCQAADQTAQQLRTLAERARDMQQDRDMLRDRDQQRDMDQLRIHLRTMADQLDESLKTMDRMQKRLGPPPAP